LLADAHEKDKYGTAMPQWTQEEVSKTLNEVARKSAVDPAFRKLCLTDPKSAIAQVNKIPIPKSFRIRFVENEGANMTVVLPDPAAPEGELSDEALEQVAAGKPASVSGPFPEQIRGKP
jgi:hypothetical protein